MISCLDLKTGSVSTSRRSIPPIIEAGHSACLTLCLVRAVQVADNIPYESDHITDSLQRRQDNYGMRLRFGLIIIDLLYIDY